ncbi:serine/arginine-rich splicing factor SR45-like [Iris pallida]|uniref:Serine/arginine-rich splicing factor SR45-like n=1 Tax=Iris pallida TaxID=29817 RepID=A0AAX6EXY4_IRIPA|nr:serine/arginine-rich splicing factor SR45-like [Iris pallida]
MPPRLVLSSTSKTESLLDCSAGAVHRPGAATDRIHCSEPPNRTAPSRLDAYPKSPLGAESATDRRAYVAGDRCYTEVIIQIHAVLLSYFQGEASTPTQALLCFYLTFMCHVLISDTRYTRLLCTLFIVL